MKKFKLNYFFNVITNKRWKKAVFAFLGIFSVFLLLSFTFSANMSDEVNSVEIESNGWKKNEPGSWHITKSAEWTDVRKARVTFDIDTVAKMGDTKKDIILVLDISGSMSGEKLDKVKSDAIGLTNVLLSNNQNRVALITFDTTAQVLFNFTNDKEAITTAISKLKDQGATNYADALRKVGDVLEGYEKVANTDLVTLFLTDGYPCEETPNQISEFAVLKDKYPYLTINGIQYEMGSTIIEQIKEISDNQYSAYVENLENVLFDAAAPTKFYETFVVNDFIEENYFELGTIENIIVSIGEASLNVENGLEKVTWNLGEAFRTGAKATMTLDIKLKDDVEITDTSIFPTNRKENVDYKIPDEVEEKVESSKTPKLKGAYKVIYDANPPTGCNISTTLVETHKPFENVTIKGDDLSNQCAGYLFKGWELDDESISGIKMVNDETFVMPSKDIYIRGTWTQVAISKFMTAEEYVLKYLMPFNGEEGFLDNTKSEFVTSNGGINFMYASSITNGQGLYVRAGTENDDYPIFYYRGEVYNNNVLFANKCWKIVRTTETGGTKLIYNGVPDTTNEKGMCANTGTASQLTTKAFNSNYSSPTDVGYMLGTRYDYKSKDMSSSGGYDAVTTPIAKSEYINITNDSTYPYTYNDSTNQWISDTKNTNSAVGTIEFSIAIDGEYYFSYDVSSETNYDKATIYVDDVQKAQYSGTVTGTISLGNLTSSNIIKVVYSKDGSVNSNRDNVIFNIAKATGVAVDNRWLYGNSVTYSGGIYTLTNTEKVSWGDDISNNHYTCFSIDNTCTKVNYIYYISEATAYYIELENGKTVDDALDDMIGNSSNVVNSTIKEYIENTWFAGADGIISYESALENTVWCNARNIRALDIWTPNDGWNPNGGSTSAYLYLGVNRTGFGVSGISKVKDAEACPNKNDRFTVNDPVNGPGNGNGKLKYKVGLITASEATIAGLGWEGSSNKSYLYTGEYFWTLSPYLFRDYYATIFFVGHDSGDLSGSASSNEYGVRPSISLKAGVKPSSGDGSAANPYRVE